jgi:hypothetical protein
VETEGRKTEHGGEEPGTTTNVVPFPRDWLGPREELIPFGSSAGYGTEQPTAAPGAEAFWGGDSGPLHPVLPEPVVAVGVAGERLRMPARRLAVGALAAVVLAAAVVGRLAGVPTSAGPSVGTDVAASGFMDLALLRGAVGPPAIEAPKPAAHAVPPRRARPAVHVHRRPAAGSRTSGSGSTGTATSATTAASAPTTSTSQPVSSTSSSSATSEAAATSSSPTHSSVSSHTASVRPGPVGPGAPFGPGQLK